MKHREKYRASKPPDAKLELPVEPKPRRVLDLESLARMHRDFAGGKGKRPYQRRQRQGRRE